jgi:hypothetical protein
MSSSNKLKQDVYSYSSIPFLSIATKSQTRNAIWVHGLGDNMTTLDAYDALFDQVYFMDSISPGYNSSAGLAWVECLNEHCGGVIEGCDQSYTQTYYVVTNRDSDGFICENSQRIGDEFEAFGVNHLEERDDQRVIASLNDIFTGGSDRFFITQVR